jgi:hypothetical protein
VHPKPILVFLLLVIPDLFLAAHPCLAQEDLKQSPPLSVTTEFAQDLGSNCNSGKGLVVQFHYAGEHPLRGYLVQSVLADRLSGKLLAQETMQEIRGSRDPMIVSGAEWTRTLCLKPTFLVGEQVVINTSGDILKFADGAVWGTMSLPQSHQLIGMIDGMDFSVKSTDLLRFVSPIPRDQRPRQVEDIQLQSFGPLRFESGVIRDENGKAMLAVEVTNIAKTPIRGYVFTISFFDSVSQKRLRRVTTKQLETQGNPADFLAPGAAWVVGARKFSRSTDGTLAKYSIIVDLVVYADGSIFGPKHSQESDEVFGMLQGIDAANRRQSLYHVKGDNP